jgi:hypothetical protein
VFLCELLGASDQLSTPPVIGLPPPDREPLGASIDAQTGQVFGAVDGTIEEQEESGRRGRFSPLNGQNGESNETTYLQLRRT